MIEQAAQLHRCGTCQRWDGPRRASVDRLSACVADETTTGLCQGGPWDGSERRARSACGRWLCWTELSAPEDSA